MTSAVLSEIGYSSTGRQKDVPNHGLQASYRRSRAQGFLGTGYGHFPLPSQHPIGESSKVTKRPGVGCV